MRFRQKYNIYFRKHFHKESNTVFTSCCFDIRTTFFHEKPENKICLELLKKATF